MTFRVETLFDQTHTCSTGHDDPDHITDRDLRTWTCSPPLRDVFQCRQMAYLDAQAIGVQLVTLRSESVRGNFVFPGPDSRGHHPPQTGGAGQPV
ncbi:hypothetical protein R5022_04460 [Pseudomonas aeruginosa]|nr:hypothetical protein [Pseudomonas aeruginosa]MBI7212672.1 hypothetical protein [Pseudomonas aeruginosa]MDI3670888.1 hypothetical protein [Pseudomonas aeruginosa]RPQ07879.1 hypothetical protein IPC1122_33680 [Pseudomonas aeruginosa]WOU27126.1 hypothetical protein R5022_04460 [Pseudomonas aeruginosa]BAQ43217.1 hypothetical protein PA257_6661 [Pseudomonas aeruginosa]